MELSVFIISFSALWKLSECVRCYECVPIRKDNLYKKEALCQDFDGSEQFVTECPSSTMCYKRETSFNVGDGVTKAVTRGCTPQTLPGYQEKIGHEWIPVAKIHEEYREQCEEVRNEERIPTRLSCYCRGDLCNGTDKTYNNVSFLAISIMILILMGR